MNIPKAIEILNDHSILLETTEDHDYLDALKLGIEALRVYRSLRIALDINAHQLLTGETIN